MEFESAMQRLRKAVDDADFKTAMARVNSPIQYMDAPAFAKYWDDDAKRLAAVVKVVGKVDDEDPNNNYYEYVVDEALCDGCGRCVKACRPPAMSARARSGGQLKVGSSSTLSSRPRRPEVPAPR